MRIVVLFLLTIVVEIFANTLPNTDNVRHYDGYSVIRVIPKTLPELKYLHEIAMNTTEIDFWTYPKALHQPVDIMLSSDQLSSFDVGLKSRSLDRTVLINDVEELIIKQKSQKGTYKIQPQFREVIPGYNSEYQRLATIHTFLDTISATAPSISSVETIGNSYQNNAIKLIKIGVNYAGNSKPIIFIDSAIHAREWISAATTAYFIEYLISGYNNGDQAIVNLLTRVDFYIAPVINPDGYEYTHTNERLWRKTRSPNAGSTCVGTDPNRNWSYQFGGPGTSTNPCSEIYHGTAAFSESETKAVSDYILSLSARVRAYLAVHSYSQLWLYPWGYTSTLTPDDEALKARAITAVTALAVPYGTQYVYGTGTNVLYAAAGAADDWGYGAANIKYSYTVELRDEGYYGFVLPADQIIPCGIETSAAFVAFSNDVLDNP